MANQGPMNTSIFSYSSEIQFGYFGWPSVGIGRDGTLLVGASGFRNAHVCPFGKAVLSRSADGGKTWSEPIIAVKSLLDVRDVGILPLDNGQFLMSYFTSDTRCYYPSGKHAMPNRIDFRGLIDSWTECEVAESLGSFCRIVNGDGSLSLAYPCPVSAPHGPVKLSDGRLLYLGHCFGKPLPEDGRIHFSMKTFSDDGIQAWSSSDHGRSWNILCEDVLAKHAGKELRFCEPHVIELKDGSLFGMMRGEAPDKHFSMWKIFSRDGGFTWTAPEYVSHGSPPHLLRLSSGAIVCSFGFRRSLFGERAIFSSDEGKTWKNEVILRGDGYGPDLGYPCTVEFPDGRLLTVYYQQVGHENHCGIHCTVWTPPPAI